MTEVRRRTLRKIQEHDSLFPLHSYKSLHCREVTLRALMWAGFLEWYDDADNGTEVIRYYTITEAGKNAGKEVVA